MFKHLDIVGIDRKANEEFNSNLRKPFKGLVATRPPKKVLSLKVRSFWDFVVEISLLFH